MWQLILVGAVAWMPAVGFEGNPLYCFPDGSQRYSLDEMWAIAPIEAILRGDVRCGELVMVELESGRTLLLPVWDASELHVKPSWLGPPFALELPEHIYTGQELVRVSVWRDVTIPSP